jgi:hypothetical protein
MKVVCPVWEGPQQDHVVRATYGVLILLHPSVKRRVNPGLGFGAFATAQRTIQGYEAMHRLRKG